MARRISERTRAAIVADLRAGVLTQAELSGNHKVSLRTVQKIKASLKAQPDADPLVERLSNLLASAEEALELARASKDSRELGAAVRAFNSTLQVVEKLRADLERQGEGSTRGLVEAVKAILVEELKPYPEARERVAARLLELDRAKP